MRKAKKIAFLYMKKVLKSQIDNLSTHVWG